MSAGQAFKTWLDENRLMHRELSSACARAQLYATLAAAGSVIPIIGPPGAGKSTALSELAAMLAGPTEMWAQGTIPIICITLEKAVKGFYNSKDTYLRGHAAIEHPYYSPYLSKRQPMESEELWLKTVRLSCTEGNLRVALETGMKSRGTKFLIVDELDMLLSVQGKERAFDHLDSLKGLARAAGAVLIVAGTYLALDVWNCTGQLNRRSYDVYVCRYRASAEDLIEFRRILSALSEGVPLPNGIDLCTWDELIHEATLGLIGEVAKLLEEALTNMELSGASVLTENLIRSGIMAQTKLHTLIRETRVGEVTLFGKSDLPDVGPMVDGERPAHTPRKPTKGRRKPGLRKPSRDPVGAFR